MASTTLKKCAFICYEESLQKPIEIIMEDLKEYLTSYAYILHDKDIQEDGTLKKSHYHVW